MSPSSTHSISQMESTNRNQETLTRDIHHLFSAILTTVLLAYLYLPRTLLILLICPSFLSYLLLIISLFQFRSSPSRSNLQSDKNDPLPPHETKEENDTKPVETCWSYISDHHYFDFTRPLGIIYEEYEGEETESGNSMEEKVSEISKEDDELERWLEYAMWLSEDKEKRKEIEDDELFEFSFGEDEDNLIELDLSRYQIEEIKPETVIGF